ATAIPSGGTTPYTYAWSSGGSSQTESGQAASTITISITDANTCLVTASATINNIAGPTASTSVTDETCGNTNGGATALPSGGTTPYSYEWSSNGTAQTESNLSASMVIVTITDANTCAITASATINNVAGPSAISSVIDATCGQANGEASVTITGGTSPYVMAWSGGAGNNTTATGLSVNTYSATIFDANSCATVVNVTVNDIVGPTTSISGINELCGASNGSAAIIVLGGTTPYNYNWSNGDSGASESGLTAGIYSVTTTDGTGCQSVESITLSNQGGASASVATTDEMCSQGNGTATVATSGGASPLSYLWSNSSTSTSITGLNGATYSVTVTDNSGCESVASGIVNNLSAPSTTITGVNETCTNTNGSVSVSTTGGTSPLSYIWNSGNTSASQSGLSADNYSVTVTDSNGCTVTTSVTIDNDQPVVSLTSSNSNCGETNGTAQVNVSGGILSYNYNWSNGETTASIENLTAATYMVTLVDGNNCLVVDTVVVGNTATPSLTVSVTDAICDEANGIATVNVNGGSTPYNYSWSGANGNSATQTGLSGGTYSAFMTDNDGCLASSLVIVGNHSSPILSVEAADATCDIDNGIITSQAIGGTGDLVYLWSNGDSTETISALEADSYTLTITDENGCTDVETIEVERIDGICFENPPSGFSPNGDGVNDVWNIPAAQYYTNLTVEIYNRWGSILFKSDGYVEPWDGRNANGKEIPSAVYYYIITLGDEEPLTGTVTIKR
ncbi:MAG: gliding motility-associated C-terminal domain-containing protein, partial [Flavobacteriales bacterium]|nr:gliding motility-associated C-terminal domain-containing protein [Flavobacteriales bacterium]